MPILGLPLTLLPTILPSIMRFNKLSSRRTCPTQFFFRFTTALARHLSSPIEDIFLHLSFYLSSSPSPFFSTTTSPKHLAYQLLLFSLSTFHNHTVLPATPMS